MGFTHNVTGATDRSSIVRGDVALISGTWTAFSVVTGTILTGGSVVLAHGVSVGSAEIGVHASTAQIIFSEKNKAGDGTAENGTIRVTQINPALTGTLAGDWWAIITV